MFKTATEAADWIQGARYKGQKNGLENMRALLTALPLLACGYALLFLHQRRGKARP